MKVSEFLRLDVCREPNNLNYAATNFAEVRN